MSFLDKVDEIYDNCKNLYNISNDNSEFCCYILVEAIDNALSSKFVIQKREKSKLLIVNAMQRVYLSDLQIIETILEMEPEDINWFLKQFVNYYNGIKCKTKFLIDKIDFDGYGIEYYPSAKMINLFSDTMIRINDFIFILNFIFSKDYYWGEKIGELEFGKRTLCKYISLIDYYANRKTRSQKFLKSIGYPYERTLPTDSKNTKKLFNDIEQFDISLYL